MRRKTVYLLTVVLLFSFFVPASVFAAASGIKITGDVGDETILTLADLKSMQTVTAAYGSLNSANTFSKTEFTGVELSAALDLAGIREGATTITFVSSDGYRSVRPISILTTKYIDNLKIILIWDENDDIQVIIPQKDSKDVNRSSWTRQLVEIAISGAPAIYDANPSGDAGIFADVPANHPAAEYIADIYNRGITTGDSATTFGPDKTLTRAQFVTFLGRLAEIDAEKFSEGPFTDISNTGFDYATGYINWSFEKGIATGMSETRFAPANKVTRQQAATFVYRYAATVSVELKGDDLNIKDAGDVAVWAKDAVDAVVATGLMSLNGGRFRPNDYCTRAEMAQVLSLFPGTTSVGTASSR